MILDDLKAKIERIEGRTKRFVAAGETGSAPWIPGLDSLDAALPVLDRASGIGALPYDACHDFTPLVKTDVPQVAGFIAALLQRLPASRLQRGPIVWCQTRVNAHEYGRIYAPGLLGSALSPDQLLFINVPREKDLALVLEECVRVPRLAAVVGEGPAPDFTASRRLTLAAQESHVPCLILNTGNTIGASAATTRWRIAPIAGPPDPLDPEGPGFAAWSITLARARGGNAALNPTLAQPVKAAWNHETHTFHLVSSFRPGAALESQTPHGQVQQPGR
jgi:protein ImuA